MADYDPYSALTVDEPTALEMAKARAAALRGQNYAGLVMGLAHDPNAARIGQEVFQSAQQGLSDLGSLPGERLKQAMDRQRMQQQGPQEALGGLPPSIYEALTKRMQVPKMAPVPVGTGALYDVHEGTVKPLPASAAGSLGALSPEALDQSAQVYIKTGQMPAMGKANPLIHKQIVERAASMSGGGDLATTRSSFHADTGSLAKLQTSADSIDAFENTALKNLDQLDQAAKAAIDTGFPILNKPIRSLDAKILGDPRMSVFNAARQTAVQEVGKVLGGAISGGAISDSQRHEVESLLSGDMTLPQIRATIQQLKTDMLNRKVSTHAQIEEIRGRLSGKAPATEAAPQATATAPDPAVVAKFKAMLKSGERLVMNAAGKAKAIGKDEAVPAGFSEVQ